MALAHNLGFPRGGRNGQLQKALEALASGDNDEADLRAAHWQLQKDAGIDLLPVANAAWCDAVLSQSLTLGVVAPSLALSGESLFEEVEHAHALGHAVKPVVTGPLSYLWQSQVAGSDGDRLEQVDRLLPVYGQIFQRLAAQGVEWVQIDEPILVLDLPQVWKNAFERVYNLLQREPLKKLVATSCGALADNLGLAVGLPVDGLHIDLVQAPQQYATVLDRLPAYKILSLGVVDGRQPHADLASAHDLLRHAHERLGERLWIAPSCSLGLDGLDPGSALQACRNVAVLAQALDQPLAACA